MDRPLKILMVVHEPWQRELGISRIQMELAEELRKLGHIVDKFSYEDAFPGQRSRFKELTCDFSVKAGEFVRHNARRFDVIDAIESGLPFTKEQLGFKGVLVARSSGLRPLYEKAYRTYRLREHPRSIKSWFTQLINYFTHKRWRGYFAPSLRAADLIILYNNDELDYVNNCMGMGSKAMVIPLGLTDRRREEFVQAMRPVAERLKNKEVAFIGCWSTRKGSADWPKIIMQVRKKVPGARFKLLGTGFKENEVLKDMRMQAEEDIKIVPHFKSEELPALLAGSTVGAFPSYVEGFGFAVLEKLACGIPVVCYDVAGVLQMLRYFKKPLLVRPRDIEAFSCAIAGILNLNAQGYSLLSDECVQISQKFRWPVIAEETLKAYLRSASNRL